MIERSRAARRPVALALCGLVALTACSAADDPPSATTPTRTSSSDAPGGATSAPVPPAEITPTHPPLTFAATSAVAFPDANVFDGAASASTVLTMSGQSLTARSMPRLEGSYTVQPIAGSFTDLWVDDEEETGILLSALSTDGGGTRVGSDTFGLQEFVVESGEVLRTANVEVRKDATGSARAATARIAGVAGDVVVLEARVPDTDTPPAVHAVDLGSGTLAWSVRGSGALAVTGALVVTTTGDADTAGSLDGLAVGTGKRRWRTLGTTGDAALVGVTPTVVAVARDDLFFGGTSLVRIDLRTGRPGRAIGSTAGGYDCEQDGVGRAVCSRADGVVLGIRLRTLETAWRLPGRTRFAPSVSLVEDGLVYGSLDNGTGVVLDARTGEDLVDLSGATPTHVNDYGALTLFVGTATFTPVGDPGPAVPATLEPSVSETASATP